MCFMQQADGISVIIWYLLLIYMHLKPRAGSFMQQIVNKTNITKSTLLFERSTIVKRKTNKIFIHSCTNKFVLLFFTKINNVSFDP